MENNSINDVKSIKNDPIYQQGINNWIALHTTEDISSTKNNNPKSSSDVQRTSFYSLSKEDDSKTTNELFSRYQSALSFNEKNATGCLKNLPSDNASSGLSCSSKGKKKKIISCLKSALSLKKKSKISFKSSLETINICQTSTETLKEIKDGDPEQNTNKVDPFDLEIKKKYIEEDAGNLSKGSSTSKESSKNRIKSWFSSIIKGKSRKKSENFTDISESVKTEIASPVSHEKNNHKKNASVKSITKVAQEILKSKSDILKRDVKSKLKRIIPKTNIFDKNTSQRSFNDSKSIETLFRNENKSDENIASTSMVKTELVEKTVATKSLNRLSCSLIKKIFDIKQKPEISISKIDSLYPSSLATNTDSQIPSIILLSSTVSNKKKSCDPCGRTSRSKYLNDEDKNQKKKAKRKPENKSALSIFLNKKQKRIDRLYQDDKYSVNSAKSSSDDQSSEELCFDQINQQFCEKLSTPKISTYKPCSVSKSLKGEKSSNQHRKPKNCGQKFNAIDKIIELFEDVVNTCPGNHLGQHYNKLKKEIDLITCKCKPSSREDQKLLNEIQITSNEQLNELLVYFKKKAAAYKVKELAKEAGISLEDTSIENLSDNSFEINRKLLVDLLDERDFTPKNQKEPKTKCKGNDKQVLQLLKFFQNKAQTLKECEIDELYKIIRKKLDQIMCRCENSARPKSKICRGTKFPLSTSDSNICIAKKPTESEICRENKKLFKDFVRNFRKEHPQLDRKKIDKLTEKYMEIIDMLFCEPKPEEFNAKKLVDCSNSNNCTRKVQRSETCIPVKKKSKCKNICYPQFPTDYNVIQKNIKQIFYFNEKHSNFEDKLNYDRVYIKKKELEKLLQQLQHIIENNSCKSNEESMESLKNSNIAKSQSSTNQSKNCNNLKINSPQSPIFILADAVQTKTSEVNNVQEQICHDKNLNEEKQKESFCDTANFYPSKPSEFINPLKRSNKSSIDLDFELHLKTEITKESEASEITENLEKTSKELKNISQEFINPLKYSNKSSINLDFESDLKTDITKETKSSKTTENLEKISKDFKNISEEKSGSLSNNRKPPLSIFTKFWTWLPSIFEKSQPTKKVEIQENLKPNNQECSVQTALKEKPLKCKAVGHSNSEQDIKSSSTIPKEEKASSININDEYSKLLNITDYESSHIKILSKKSSTKENTTPKEQKIVRIAPLDKLKLTKTKSILTSDLLNLKKSCKSVSVQYVNSKDKKYLSISTSPINLQKLSKNIYHENSQRPLEIVYRFLTEKTDDDCPCDKEEIKNEILKAMKDKIKEKLAENDGNVSPSNLSSRSSLKELFKGPTQKFCDCKDDDKNKTSKNLLPSGPNEASTNLLNDLKKAIEKNTCDCLDKSSPTDIEDKSSPVEPPKEDKSILRNAFNFFSKRFSLPEKQDQQVETLNNLNNEIKFVATNSVSYYSAEECRVLPEIKRSCQCFTKEKNHHAGVLKIGAGVMCAGEVQKILKNYKEKTPKPENKMKIHVTVKDARYYDSSLRIFRSSSLMEKSKKFYPSISNNVEEVPIVPFALSPVPDEVEVKQENEEIKEEKSTSKGTSLRSDASNDTFGTVKRTYSSMNSRISFDSDFKVSNKS